MAFCRGKKCKKHTTHKVPFCFGIDLQHLQARSFHGFYKFFLLSNIGVWYCEKSIVKK